MWPGSTIRNLEFFEVSRENTYISNRMKKKSQWESFLKCVASGMSISDAAVSTRISRIAVYNKRDRDPEFAKDLDQALIATKIRAVGLIQKAMVNQWQAGAWWLERRWPDEYSVKSNPLINLTFKQNDKLKPLENEKLIEVTIDSEPAKQIENNPG